LELSKLLERLEREAGQTHESHRQKVEKWLRFVAYWKTVWQHVGVEHYKISDSWAWPSNVYTPRARGKHNGGSSMGFMGSFFAGHTAAHGRLVASGFQQRGSSSASSLLV
jgi:hypothetical protein